MKPERRPSSAWLALSGVLLVLLAVGWLMSQAREPDEVAELPATAGAEPAAPQSQPITLPATPSTLAAPLAEPEPPAAAGESSTAAVPALEILVVDTSNQPIAGALIYTTGNGAKAMTAEGGRATLPAPRPPALTVAAYDFCPLEVPVPEPGHPEAEPLRVALERSAVLDVRVLGPAGQPAAGLQVQLDGLGDLYAPDVRLDTLPAGRPRAFACDAEGRCLITRLLPEVPFSLTVLDRYGTELSSAQRLSLAHEERRALSLVIACPPRSLAVSVRDGSGAPVAGVKVVLESRCEAQGGKPASGGIESTDESGVVVFDGLCASHASVRAFKPAQGLAWREELALVGALTAVDLTLGPSRAVDVAVVDAAGRLQWVDRVLARLGDTLQVEAHQVQPGAFRFDALPEGDIVLVAERLSRSWTVTHDTSLARATIEIPTPGHLQLRWSLSGVAVAGMQLQLRRRDNAAKGDGLDLVPVPRYLQRSDGKLLIQTLMPGDYDVCLVVNDPGMQPRPLSQTARVEIVANAIADVSLGP